MRAMIIGALSATCGRDYIVGCWRCIIGCGRIVRSLHGSERYQIDFMFSLCVWPARTSAKRVTFHGNATREAGTALVCTALYLIAAAVYICDCL